MKKSLGYLNFQNSSILVSKSDFKENHETMLIIILTYLDGTPCKNPLPILVEVQGKLS